MSTVVSLHVVDYVGTFCPCFRDSGHILQMVPLRLLFRRQRLMQLYWAEQSTVVVLGKCVRLCKCEAGCCCCSTV